MEGQAMIFTTSRGGGMRGHHTRGWAGSRSSVKQLRALKIEGHAKSRVFSTPCGTSGAWATLGGIGSARAVLTKLRHH